LFNQCAYHSVSIGSSPAVYSRLAGIQPWLKGFNQGESAIQVSSKDQIGFSPGGFRLQGAALNQQD